MTGILEGELETLETIFVVDDDPMVLSLVTGILNRAHFHVLFASNGDDAIKIAKETEGRIDLLLSDVDMPLKLCSRRIPALLRSTRQRPLFARLRRS